MFYAFLVIGFLVLITLIWLLTSVRRGSNKRDKRIWDAVFPIINGCQTGKTVSRDDVRQAAQEPEVRYMLFAILRKLDKTGIIPDDFNALQDQAQSSLTYWMLHPNELGAKPEAMELVETVERRVENRDSRFFVFRYKMPIDHWAGKDGWILGIAGPFFPAENIPYGFNPGAFSRIDDVEDKIEPEELADWYINTVYSRGGSFAQQG